MPICPNCKSEVEAGTKFCMECGADLAGENANTFTDPRDGQVYKTVKIGNQVWLAENFRYKCDGSYAYDDDNKNIKKFGRLYTWKAAMNCAPPGWHFSHSGNESKQVDFRCPHFAQIDASHTSLVARQMYAS